MKKLAKSLRQFATHAILSPFDSSIDKRVQSAATMAVEQLEQRVLFGFGWTTYNFEMQAVGTSSTEATVGDMQFKDQFGNDIDAPVHDALAVGGGIYISTAPNPTEVTAQSSGIRGVSSIEYTATFPNTAYLLAGLHCGPELSIDLTFDPSGASLSALGTAWDFEFLSNNCPDKSARPVRYSDGAAELVFDDFGDLVDPELISFVRDWSNKSYGGEQPGAKLANFGLGGMPWIDELFEGQYGDASDKFGFIGVAWNSMDTNIMFYSTGQYPSSFGIQRDDGNPTTITHDAGTHLWCITEGNGAQWFFADSTNNWNVRQRGTLVKRVNPAGVIAEIVDWNGNYLPETYRITYPAVNGQSAKVDEFEFSYVDTDQISSLVLSRGTLGSVTPIRTVNYEYYTSTVADQGSDGDLKNVTIYDGEDTDPVREKQYYRWYTDTDDGKGYDGGLKMWLGGDAYKKASQVLGTVESATDANLDNYADNYFEYDSDKRVTKEIAQGAGCSCAGIEGQGEYRFVYDSINDGSGGALNTPIYKTIEYLPDHTNTVPSLTLGSGDLTSSSTTATVDWTAHGFSIGDEIEVSGATQDEYNGFFTIDNVSTDSFTYIFDGSGTPTATGTIVVKNMAAWADNDQNVVYTNQRGQPILKVVKDTSESTETLTHWQYDDQGQVTLTAHSSAIDSYNASTGEVTLHASAGKIETTEYFDSGDAPEAGLIGYKKAAYVQRGSSGTAQKQAEWTYTDGAVNDDGIYFVNTMTEYAGAGGTDGQTTQYDYTWHVDGSSNPVNQIKKRTTTRAKITSSQNGPDTSSSSYIEEEHFDTRGNLIWTKDGDGRVNFFRRDPATGAVIEQIIDVDDGTSISDPAVTAPSSIPTDGLALTTTYAVDAFGRETKRTDPIGNITYTVYDDTTSDSDPIEVRVYEGWNGTTKQPTGPVRVFRSYPELMYTEELSFTYADVSGLPVDGSGVPTGAESLADADTTIQSLVRTHENISGQVVQVDAYHNFNSLTYTTGTLGSSGTNYNSSKTGYDEKGRVNRVETPNGTITRYVRDARGLVLSTWVGTDDTPTSGFWSLTNQTATNLVKVSENEYDDNGNRIETTQKPGGGAADRVTQYHYDWRDRLVAVKQGVGGSESGTPDTQRQITYFTYDNLGQLLTEERFDGDNVTISDGNTDGIPDSPSSSLRRAKTSYEYDDQGRLFRTTVHSVDPSAGTPTGGGLVTNMWFDRRGNVIKTSQPGGLVTKMQYDGAGRPIKTFASDGGGDSTWSHAGGVAK